MRHLNHRPGVRVAIDEEPVAKFDFAQWCCQQIERRVEIGDLWGRAICYLMQVA